MAEYVNEVRLGVSKILEGLKISPGNFLDDLPGRSICPKCQKSRKYFCYTCYVPMDEIADKIPKLKVRHIYFTIVNCRNTKRKY